MFALRCLGVSLSFFLLSYAASSIAVMRGWRIACRAGRNVSVRRLADALFILRGLPLTAAALLTLAFVVPSFLLLEPRVVLEPVGEIPLFLGACCLLLLGAGLANAIAAHRKTSRSVNGWMQGATAASGCYSVPLFRIRPSTPALALTGLRVPRVLLSDAAAAVLTKRELETALRHELVHVHRRDNLKKLFFRLCALPGMAGLESAWSEAAEMAADDAAVSSTTEALDLASALIKLSRFAPVHPVAGLAMSLLQSSGSTLNARVERLVAWDESRAIKPPRLIPWYLAPALCGAVFCVVMNYALVLGRMHELTEWLVR
jgi:Zn-dependent protease with chaperone function